MTFQTSFSSSLQHAVGPHLLINRHQQNTKQGMTSGDESLELGMVPEAKYMLTGSGSMLSRRRVHLGWFAFVRASCPLSSGLGFLPSAKPPLLLLLGASSPNLHHELRTGGLVRRSLEAARPGLRSSSRPLLKCLTEFLRGFSASKSSNPKEAQEPPESAWAPGKPPPLPPESLERSPDLSSLEV